MSNALYQYQMTSDKAVSREIQVNSARKAAEDTKELFNLGTSTYLEVLSAEQSYLSAQLQKWLIPRPHAVCNQSVSSIGRREREIIINDDSES